MQVMINRWKDKLNSTQEKLIGSVSHPPKPEPAPSVNTDHALKQSGLMSIKKSLDKSKKSLHSHEEKIHSSKRITTPSKKKSRNSKAYMIEKSCEAIQQIFGKLTVIDKTIQMKIKNVLEDLWVKCHENPGNGSPRKNFEEVKDLEQSILRQSTMSSSAAKRQDRLYQDLQKRYFECEKQRQFLKNKIEEIIKKYENVEKQLERYSKIQKLVDNCLEREQAARQENRSLQQQLQLAELRQVEQQKIFEEEISIVRELVEEMKKNLPTA